MFRRTQLIGIITICVFFGLTLLFLEREPASFVDQPSPPTRQKVVVPDVQTEISSSEHPTTHPIDQLIRDAEEEFRSVKNRQSKSLEDAVQEYKRRYKVHPPPKFDQWYKFAKAKGVQLIDEFDTIYHSLLPFWALKPSVIRARAREALGYDNALLGLLIRNGQVISAAGGTEWQQVSTVQMVKNFVQHLPDLDLPFNIHDEPRVIVPHDDLSRLVAIASDQNMPAAFKIPAPKNKFSPRPADMDDGKRFHEFKASRFNKFAHQATWTHSRQSCSPHSPSRALDDSPVDDVSPYSFSELGFISNKTAFTDICLSPSLRERYGFFNRPNAFDIVHDLFPIFSQSKVSSYQDILYPSPWYWSEKVPYREEEDYGWEQKKDQMYWRGSTTGGFSRDGGWRHQHRQLIVGNINALSTGQGLEMRTHNGSAAWEVVEVPQVKRKSLFNVQFSHVGQCDPEDCDAQREFFNVTEPESQYVAWGYKYLLDMDGNAFSGRFYAFLRSHSLVFKMAMFREWHEEWLRPWVHYVPLSLKGDEHIESVRYFRDEATGKIQGPKMAKSGREWAARALRQDDFEVWLFRLLIE
jgi:hypothetical protein